MQALRFTVADSEGNPVTALAPYLDAFGHLVMIRAQTCDYIHVHPGSAIPRSSADSAGPTVVFLPMGMYGPIRPGVFRLFFQANPDNNLILTAFTVLIPPGFRDEFLFSCQVPAEEATLSWKAYQTYSDGSVVAWELASNVDQPKTEDGHPDFSSLGPASKTQIVNDLVPVQAAGIWLSSNTSSLIVSLIAIVFSAVSVVLQILRRKPVQQL